LCKGTSIHFLTSPTLPDPPLLPPCLYVLPPHLCTISKDHTQRPTTFALIVRRLCKSQLPDVVDFLCPHPLLPQQHQMSLKCIGTGPCDTMAPSVIMRVPIYGRLDTRRLCKGTSVCFLTSPILSHLLPVHMYSPSSPLYYLQGPYLQPTTFRPDGPTTFQKSTHR
jgi:hypothetical protein